MFEQTFKNIDDILYKDSGADSELDYIGQTSWVLFLKYLDDLEKEKADAAALEGKEHQFILEEEYRWGSWAKPETDGKPDHHKEKSGPDLLAFVNDRLFPYLAKFKEKSKDDPKTIQYKIGEIFNEIGNKIKSGYNLRGIIDLVDELSFQSRTEKHELSHLYETKIKNMGNAGRNGGQYYTPRPLIKAMVRVTDPQVGETVYDGAVGSAGFLCEAHEYMYERMKPTTANLKKLREDTFYGVEKKNLAFVIGVMNMILHGIEAPNIKHDNTLSQNIQEIRAEERHEVVLANPPFGGKERKEVQQNFPIKTGETAFLFLQHFIKKLKAGGRAAVVIKNTFLSNTDNASVSLRKHLLETCRLHTVLDMPAGTFLGAGVKTVVLFFEKGEPTLRQGSGQAKNIWYYQLDPGRNLGKTNPLNEKDLEEFTVLQKEKPETERSWNLDLKELQDWGNYDLSVKNPNTPEEEPLRAPEEILREMKSLDRETQQLLTEIEELV